LERKRVLLVGLDGAPYDLVKRWTDEGELPNLKELIRAGGFGVLYSRLDETPPAWSSIYTGKNPGKHGVFDFQFRKPGTHEFVPVNSTRRDGKDIWEILGEQGLRVGVLNAPIAYPAREVNGVLVAGFLTPGEDVSYTFPESLQAEIKAAVPGFRHSSADEIQLNLQKEKYVQAIYDKVENLGKAARYLISRDQFDFFSLIISETDHVQHWFWDKMEGGPGTKYEDVILNTYKIADRVLGDIVKEYANEGYVVVVSDHGGTRLKRLFHTNYFLHSIGMLSFRRSIPVRAKQGLYSLGVTQGLFGLVARTKVYPLRYLLRPLSLTLKDVDWNKTRAYSFGYGQIYLNVGGAGGQTSGDAAKNVTDEDIRTPIIEALLGAVDTETGTKPIVGAWRREEMFSGPHASEAPDIQVSLAEGYEAFPWASIADRVFSPNTSRSGGHNTRGIVLVKGEGIKQGDIAGAAVTDIAPTILYLMGVGVPPDMDGHILTQAFTEEHLRTDPPKAASSEAKHPGNDDKKQYSLSDDEEQVIEKNLRSLGYI
jgi:predicted AlkP superfamily phosphohydrolase/phosphomutase